jgi:hypothetical protein
VLSRATGPLGSSFNLARTSHRAANVRHFHGHVLGAAGIVEEDSHCFTIGNNRPQPNATAHERSRETLAAFAWGQA